MRLTKRELLKALASVPILSYLGCKGVANHPSVAPSSRRNSAPKVDHFVALFLGGGFDALYTTAPKLEKDVPKDYDFLSSSNSLVDVGLNAPLGPHLSDMRDHAHKLAILNGVGVSTANHYTGVIQAARLRTHVSRMSPPIFELIGYADPSRQGLGTITLGRANPLTYMSRSLSSGDESDDSGSSSQGAPTLLAYLDRMTAAELQQLSRAIEHQTTIWQPRAIPEDRTSADNIRRTSQFLTDYAAARHFEPRSWSEVRGEQRMARNLQRALWLIEHDLTKCVFIEFGDNDWDSHQHNLQIQAEMNVAFFRMLARFLTELRHTPRGSRTLVLVLSELGRNQLINDAQGKDHFPEAPVIFCGDIVRPGVFGSVGSRMDAQPISLNDGLKSRGGVLPILDDVGTTVLHWAGMDPALFGYHGRRLQFLEAT
jgi:uncharacterized protein (DUF1501 family)